jgi:hypothetical protein
MGKEDYRGTIWLTYKLSMFHIEYVNCIGEILFTVDSTTLEEIGKRYQSL